MRRRVAMGNSKGLQALTVLALAALMGVSGCGGQGGGEPGSDRGAANAPVKGNVETASAVEVNVPEKPEAGKAVNPFEPIPSTSETTGPAKAEPTVSPIETVVVVGMEEKPEPVSGVEAVTAAEAALDPPETTETTKAESDESEELTFKWTRTNVILWEYGETGPASLDEMVARSTVVVRATLESVRPVGVRTVDLVHYPSLTYDGYVGSLEFTFKVLEYLKGSGGKQVKAAAYGWPEGVLAGETPAAAAEKASELLDVRDDRWDDREAVLFLRVPPSFGDPPYGYFWLGKIGLSELSGRAVTVADAEFRAWLPDADSSPDGGQPSRPRRANDQRFLLEDPAGSKSAASSTSSTPSITLADLKAKIDAMEAEIAAAGGSQAYRDCIAKGHEEDRYGRLRHHRLHEGEIGSGLPAGTRMTTNRDYLSASWSVAGFPGGEVRHRGRDADLMRFEAPAYTVSTRPLPAGEYRSFAVHVPDSLAVCNWESSTELPKNEHVVTVTAPAGTLAESFLDPVTDGDALTATTKLGTIKWESGEVVAQLKVDATGHALDFIELDGSVSLSLDVADATHTDGAMSWSVRKQPWSDGDQLMLRIRLAPSEPPTRTSP